MSTAGSTRSPWALALGPAITLCFVGLVQVLSLAGWRIPNPPHLLLLAAVFSAYQGGVGPGLVSVAILIGHSVIHFSAPNAWFSYSQEDTLRLAIIALTAPTIVLMVTQRSRLLRLRAAEQVANAESRQQALLATSQELLLLLSERGTVAFVSPAQSEIAGHPPETWQGRSLTELVHPEDQTAARELLATAGRGAEATGKLRLQHADGRWLLFAGRLRSMPPRRDQPPHMACSLTDITVQQQAADQLRQALNEQRTVLAALPVAVLIADARGRIRESNAAARALWGTIRWPESLEQFERFKARHPETGRLVAPAEFPLTVALTSGVSVLGQTLEIEGQNGLRRLTLCSAVPLREGDRSTGAVLVQVDLTEKRHAEDQMRRLQRMEALERLAGGVAHDFNNQLTVISGYTERLVDRLPASDPMRAHLETILRTANHAAALTRQLQAFSRRGSGETQILDLATLVTEVEPILRHLTGNDVRLTLGTQRIGCQVRADRAVMEQVLMNLTIQARNALGHGGALALTVRPTADGAVELTVSGTAPEPQGGEAARTVGASAADKTPDLARTEALVQQLGGQLTAAHAGAGGAMVFRARLPGAPGGEECGATTPPEGLQGAETILLIQDEQGVRELMTEVLRLRGYHVLSARNGAEALLLSCRHPGPIQLLLCDVEMPDMRGAELASRLGRTRPELRVILVADQPQGAATDSADGLRLLPRPFTPDALTRAVRTTLG